MNGNFQIEINEVEVSMTAPDGKKISGYIDERDPAVRWIELLISRSEIPTFYGELLDKELVRYLEDKGIIDKQTKDDGKR